MDKEKITMLADAAAPDSASAAASDSADATASDFNLRLLADVSTEHTKYEQSSEMSYPAKERTPSNSSLADGMCENLDKACAGWRANGFPLLDEDEDFESLVRFRINQSTEGSIGPKDQTNTSNYQNTWNNTNVYVFNFFIHARNKVFCSNLLSKVKRRISRRILFDLILLKMIEQTYLYFYESWFSARLKTGVILVETTFLLF